MNIVKRLMKSDIIVYSYMDMWILCGGGSVILKYMGNSVISSTIISTWDGREERPNVIVTSGYHTNICRTMVASELILD